MIILAIGDIVGNPGLEMLERHLGSLIKLYRADAVIVNGENASTNGISANQANRMLYAGADAITLGNHVWSRRDIVKDMDNLPFLIRPYNFSSPLPGEGIFVFTAKNGVRVGVLSLLGRCGMNYIPDNPFYAADKAINSLSARCDVIVVDMHAEATSEKRAMGYYLDGRVSALFGTHTHVQTADEQVLPRGTGYITDLGMTGPINSVLGIKPEQSISFFLGGVPQRYETAPGPCMLCGAAFELDEAGKCLSVSRINII